MICFARYAFRVHNVYTCKLHSSLKDNNQIKDGTIKLIFVEACVCMRPCDETDQGPRTSARQISKRKGELHALECALVCYISVSETPLPACFVWVEIICGVAELHLRPIKKIKTIQSCTKYSTLYLCVSTPILDNGCSEGKPRPPPESSPFPSS